MYNNAGDGQCIVRIYTLGMRACRPVRVSLMMDTSNQSTSCKQRGTQSLVVYQTDMLVTSAKEVTLLPRLVCLSVRRSNGTDSKYGTGPYDFFDGGTVGL